MAVMRGLSIFSLLLFAVASVQGLKPENAMCTYHPNLNISSPDIVPATYQISSYICCELCSTTPGCVAAVYNHYLCSLKGSTKTTPSIGGTVVNLQGVTSSPTSSTQVPTWKPVTQAPATQVPTWKPVTQAPATQVPTWKPVTQAPATQGPTYKPATPAPTQYTKQQLVLRTMCQSSSTCNLVTDSTCRTHAYKANGCYNQENNAKWSETFTCYPGFVVHDTYNTNNNCQGISTTTSENRGVCEEDTNTNYRKVQCKELVEVPNIPIFRQSCQEPGSQCRSSFYYSGQCMHTGSSHKGASIRVWCGDDFVWWVNHDSSDCSGSYIETRAEPLGVTYQNDNSNYITWSCNATATP